MIDQNEDEFVCPRCSSKVREDDDFCTHCGELFADGTVCSTHEQSKAIGACIICACPCCELCGEFVDGHFLCDHHSSYEIYAGMVRVDGIFDDASAQRAKIRLEEFGFHPVLFCRHDSVRSSRPRYAPYVPSDAPEEADPDKANEIKVMVPCGEVEEAEKVLGSHNQGHAT